MLESFEDNIIFVGYSCIHFVFNTIKKYYKGCVKHCSSFFFFSLWLSKFFFFLDAVMENQSGKNEEIGDNFKVYTEILVWSLYFFFFSIYLIFKILILILNFIFFIFQFLI